MTEQRTSGGFGGFNGRIIEDFRAHAGQITQGPFAGRALLLLTTRGRTSGAERTSPLVFTRDGDRYVVIASKGGAPTHPDWYRNLLTDPRVIVELGSERSVATASVAQGDERRRLYDAHAARMPAFHEYERRTTRQIPVVVLVPVA